MNDRTMSAPRRVDTRWPQTQQMPQTRTRVLKKHRPRIDWLAVVLLLAAAMVAATLIYATTGPAWQ